MTEYHVFSQGEADQGTRKRQAAGSGLRARLLPALLVIAALIVAACGTQSATASQPAGALTEFPLPQSPLIPAAITTGPDGNLWFTDPCSPPDQASDCTGSQIGRITPDGKVTTFPLPAAGNPEGITAGPDGNLWFTVSRVDAASQIGRITPAGQITEFPLSGGVVQPFGITAGPDHNLWFVGYTIGRITPGGQVTQFPLPGGSASGGQEITAGRDGNLWFAEQSGKIGRITPAGQITEFPADGSGGIAAGSDGNLWFTEVGKIGRITPAGQVTEFPLSSAQSDVEGITAGPDGNLWFTGCTPNLAASDGCIDTLVGRITPTGQITTFPLPVGTAAFDITTGPDKNLWFTENNSSDIGRISAGK